MNPYWGIEQIIESANGRAVSVDGVNWELQLLARRPGGWGSLNRQGSIDYARYAIWSASDGLARYPRVPSTEFDSAAAIETLLAAIADGQESLPFPLLDVFEYWRCVDNQPLALLATADVAPERGGGLLRWRALPEDPRAADLEARVNRLGNQSIWFQRQVDGSGLCLAMPACPEVLPLTTFPECLLSVDVFAEADDRALVTAYLARNAARLLMLPLTGDTRAQLERAASDDAPGVAHFWRLYPSQANPELITRLRVEARLRAAAARFL